MHGSTRRRPGRTRVRRFGYAYGLLGFLCYDVAAVVGFVRQMAHSPADWPVAAAIGLSCAVVAAAGWRRFLRMPKRRTVNSRLANVLAGVVALGLAIFILDRTFQILGDLVYRVIPHSWVNDGVDGMPFHPDRPSLLVACAAAFVLALLLMLTWAATKAALAGILRTRVPGASSEGANSEVALK